MDRDLRRALLKLHQAPSLPASQFSDAQRRALDEFARQTKAVSCQPQGRGEIYRVSDQERFQIHLGALSPEPDKSVIEDLPRRAQHIAQARNSKAGRHGHQGDYLLLKAVGEGLIWRADGGGHELPLSVLSRDFGAASLYVEPHDTWASDAPLWLIENQALFVRTDWLPADTQASLLYYGGQLDGRLLAWLGARPRAPLVVLFADYDGVGLANFARLYAQLGAGCEFWLMPDWQIKLARYGNPRLWQATLREFTRAAARLPDDLSCLVESMRQSGLALEQEAVWLHV